MARGATKKKTKDVGKAFEKKLDRLERVEKPYEPWELHLDLAAAGRSGDRVAALDHAVVGRGTFRLGPLDVELFRGERLALLGPNGSGRGRRPCSRRCSGGCPSRPAGA